MYVNVHVHSCPSLYNTQALLMRHVCTYLCVSLSVQIQSIVNATKPLKRERKHSTSSSASSISAHSTSCQPPRFQNHGNRHSAGGGTTSQRHSAPFRASSDPEISLMTRTSPAPVSKSWQPIPHTLPSTHVSLSTKLSFLPSYRTLEREMPYLYNTLYMYMHVSSVLILV